MRNIRGYIWQRIAINDNGCAVGTWTEASDAIKLNNSTIGD